jgi:hypothetical protein
MVWVWMDGIHSVLMTIFASCSGCIFVGAGLLSLYCAPSSGEFRDFLLGLDVIGFLHYGWMISRGGVFLVDSF